MSKHQNRTQLNDYLDGSLSAAESRAVWAHLQDCPRCYERLKTEEALRDELRRQFTAVPAQGDLSALLPGILTEAHQPAPESVNRTAFWLFVLLTLVVMLPLSKDFDLEELTPNDPPIFNVPIATYTLTARQHVTDEAEEIRARNYIDAESFDLEYASPVPLPRVTAAPSAEPSEQQTRD